MSELDKMIRSTLKRIFPVAFLKRCFVAYNKVKNNTIDRLVYREILIPEKDFQIKRKDYPFRVNRLRLDLLKGSPAYRFMLDWMDWTQEEFLLDFQLPCWIEPKYGWAMVPPNGLVFESFAFSRTDHQRKPDLFRFWFRRSSQCQRLTKAISLRDSGEENYFHFYNDVLIKLFFLKRNGVDVENTPVIISDKLWQKPYFQYYLDHSPLLGSLQWVVQKQQYIYCTSIIFCKPLTHRMDLWSCVVAPLSLPASTQNRKIFLTRSKSRLRFIENHEEIEATARRHGYTVVDSDDLSPPGQLELFSSTGYLIAIHGAGLTNMVFRKGRMQVLEIFPPPEVGYLPYHYILLAGMMTFPYRAFVGEPGRVRFSGGFYVEPTAFDQAIVEFDHVRGIDTLSL